MDSENHMSVPNGTDLRPFRVILSGAKDLFSPKDSSPSGLRMTASELKEAPFMPVPCGKRADGAAFCKRSVITSFIMIRKKKMQAEYYGKKHERIIAYLGETARVRQGIHILPGRKC